MLTKEEIRSLAAALVNSVLADVLMDFPNIRQDVDSLDRADWAELIEAKISDVEEILVIRFGTSD